jgi:Flp pilus assembly protein TadD
VSGDHHDATATTGIFVAAMIALVVCGCIFTRKPRKRSPTEILRSVVPDEHQPGFALEASLMTGTPLPSQLPSL